MDTVSTSVAEELGRIRAILVEHVDQGHDMHGRLAGVIERLDDLLDVGEHRGRVTGGSSHSATPDPALIPWRPALGPHRPV